MSGAAAPLTEREEESFKGGFLMAGFRPEGALLYNAFPTGEARMWKLITIAMRPGCEGFGLPGLRNRPAWRSTGSLCALWPRSPGEL